MSGLKEKEEELEREREKLNTMVDQAMGSPIAKNEALIKQSRKVDKLMDRIQKEKNCKPNRDHER